MLTRERMINEINEIAEKPENLKFLTRRWKGKRLTFTEGNTIVSHEICYIWHNMIHKSMSDDDLTRLYGIIIETDLIYG